MKAPPSSPQQSQRDTSRLDNDRINSRNEAEMVCACPPLIGDRNKRRAQPPNGTDARWTHPKQLCPGQEVMRQKTLV